MDHQEVGPGVKEEYVVFNASPGAIKQYSAATPARWESYDKRSPVEAPALNFMTYWWGRPELDSFIYQTESPRPRPPAASAASAAATKQAFICIKLSCLTSAPSLRCLHFPKIECGHMKGPHAPVSGNCEIRNQLGMEVDDSWGRSHGPGGQ